VTVKIGLKQEDEEDKTMMELLLKSRVMKLVISLEYVKKNKFKKLKRLVYIRNIDDIFNLEGLTEYMVKVELFYKIHKERIKIDVIKGLIWSVILEIL